jgi:membrane protein
VSAIKRGYGLFVSRAKGKGKKAKRQDTHLDDAAGVLVGLVAMLAALIRAVAVSLRRPRPRPAAATAGPGADCPPVPELRLHEQAPPTGIKRTLYQWGDRFRPLGVALRVQDRFGRLYGNYLAGAITLQAFLALFPLILLTVSVVGFIAGNRNPNLAVELIAKLGVTGDAARSISDAIDTAVKTKGTALGLGTLGLVWSSLGLVGALQYAYDQVWQVEPRGVKDKLVGLAWLAGAAVLFVGSAAATAVLGILPGFLWPVSILVTLVVNIALWLWTAKLLPNRDVGWRPLLPGAILGGVGLEALKIIGRFYVPRAVASASALYGSLGIVFAVLAWLFFFGRLIVYSAVLNVVLWEEKAGTVEAVVEVPATDNPAPAARRPGQADPDAA